MKFKTLTVSTIALLTIGAFGKPVVAQEAPTLFGDFSVRVPVSDWSTATFSGGGGVKYQNVSLSVDVLSVTTTGGGSSGNYFQTFNNGQSRCRSGSTGRFVTNASCSGDITYAFLDRVGLTYDLPLPSPNNYLILGGALDLADPNQLYGVIGYRAEKVYLKGLLGNGSVFLNLGVNF
jgi:hypothetical protein